MTSLSPSIKHLPDSWASSEPRRMLPLTRERQQLLGEADTLTDAFARHHPTLNVTPKSPSFCETRAVQHRPRKSRKVQDSASKCRKV